MKIILTSIIFFVFSSFQNAYFENLQILPSPQKNQPPYIYCNEFGQNESIEDLKLLPSLKNGVHIGWSIEMNYKIILAREPKLAILCDINKNVLNFFNHFQACILKSNNSQDFFQTLKESLKIFLKKNRLIETTKQKYESWIISESNYQLLKTMYEEGRICHLALDVTDKEGRFAILAQWLADNNYLLDTIYLSNIASWLKETTTFENNLKLLFSPQTIRIEADHSLNQSVKIPFMNIETNL